MKVFVAGATGVLGRQLVPQLVAKGHDVVGMTRNTSKQDLVRSLGARPVVADALDPAAVAQAVASAEPEVIVHQLTALSGEFDMRHIDRFFEATNRLRTEGTDHLLAAGRAVGARRFVAQSFAGWPAARTGGPVKGEDAPFDPDPPEKLRGMLNAIRHLEQAVTGAGWLEGVVLRYGGFYGPGTTLSADPAASHTAAVRKRQFPVVGDGGVGAERGAGAVEAAVAEHHALEPVRAGHRVLQVADRVQHAAELLRRIGIEGRVLGLHGAAGACRRPAREALRHETARPDRAGGREQVVGALRAQPVRRLEEPVDVTHVERARQRRELMHDHVGLGGRHRLGDRVGIERVGDDGASAQAAHQVLLRCAPGHPDHLVAFRHEPRDEPPAENACGAGDEDLHRCSSRLVSS